LSSQPPTFEFNLAESFPVLTKPPVVEVVLDVRCEGSESFTETSASEMLKDRLVGYPNFFSTREVRHHVQFNPDQPTEASTGPPTWSGFQFKSADNLNTAQFAPGLFFFSRVAPYLGWPHFVEEVTGLWEQYRDIAQPVRILRMGLRFINRIDLREDPASLDQYLRTAPRSPEGLEVSLGGFFQGDLLIVPGTSYSINSMRTNVPPPAPGMGRGSLILDTDVFATEGLDGGNDKLLGHLEKMRWLKNKVFFGTVTSHALEPYL